MWKSVSAPGERGNRSILSSRPGFNRVLRRSRAHALKTKELPGTATIRLKAGENKTATYFFLVHCTAVSILLGLLTLAACENRSWGSSKPLSAAALSEDYEKSRAQVRSKYDGKEIFVTGYAATAATLPKSGEDQGSVCLTEKDQSASAEHRVTCWLSRDQTAEFSKVKAGQPLTVKGVFNGEAGVELKFCKLVKLEVP
jgi:putative nucleic acid binding protein